MPALAAQYDGMCSWAMMPSIETIRTMAESAAASRSGQQVPDQQGRRFEVDGQGVVPDAPRRAIDRSGAGDAGAVHQSADGPDGVPGGGDGAGESGGIADVEAEADSGHPGLLGDGGGDLGRRCRRRGPRRPRAGRPRPRAKAVARPIPEPPPVMMTPVVGAGAKGMWIPYP